MYEMVWYDSAALIGMKGNSLDILVTRKLKNRIVISYHWVNCIIIWSSLENDTQTQISVM